MNLLTIVEDILSTPPIIGITINTIPINPAANIFFYAVLAVAFLIPMLYLLIIKRMTPKNTLKLTCCMAFFISGIFYTAFGEAAWLRWLKSDIGDKILTDANDKLLKLEGPLYEFSSICKSLIPLNESYEILSTDPYLPYRLEYFLLPRMKMPNGRYVIVISNIDATYYPEIGILKTNTRIIENLDLIYQYKGDAFILVKK